MINVYIVQKECQIIFFLNFLVRHNFVQSIQEMDHVVNHIAVFVTVDIILQTVPVVIGAIHMMVLYAQLIQIMDYVVTHFVQETINGTE